MKIETLIAMNRFGFGGNQGDAKRIGSDPRGWINSQIRDSQSTPAVLSNFRSSEEIFTEVNRARMESRETLRTLMRNLYKTDFARECMARAGHMVRTKDPFAERMVLFWSNHFTVSRSKWIVGPIIPAYEREAIRPNIFGKFSEMLAAVVQHPAMITYLDNHLSVGSNSNVGRRRIARKGIKTTLNENLAREILELHTLGVDGGYTQQDIIELAKSISGWSHGGIRRGPLYSIDSRAVFRFEDSIHEPGHKIILGKRYRENGVHEGLQALEDLARHPSTALFIATKLVRHFVSDDPPNEAVAKIAKVFSDTEGDLAAVSNAIVELDEVWATPLPKVKSAYELIVAAHRSVGDINPKVKNVLQPLRELGQLPFSAPSPQGWGDRSQDWIAPTALIRRVQWLRRYSRQLPSTVIPNEIAKYTIGPVAEENTEKWIGLATSRDAALATLFASPEFQRR
ncbi:MAG: DUF1800 domain-containing protein [Pseudomonadota bacterium]|nr:DUF1800 domain-containing protein [Pseudomonadota bacterium]